MSRRIPWEFLVLSFLYSITAIFWVLFVMRTGHSASYEGAEYETLLKPFLIGMTVLPLVGGVFGLYKSIAWGAFHSLVGRGLLFISLGTLSWGLGMFVWNYYLFIEGTEVPYPSIADAFFILIWAFWTYGMFQLGKASGIIFALRNSGAKLIAAVVPVAIIAVTYYLLVMLAKGGEMFSGGPLAQTALEFFYPIGDMAILSTAFVVFLLSYKFLGGMYRIPILVLVLAFALNYVADFIFTFTTAGENITYFNGHVVDLLYTSAMYMVASSVCFFDPRRLGSQTESV